MDFSFSTAPLEQYRLSSFTQKTANSTSWNRVRRAWMFVGVKECPYSRLARHSTGFSRQVESAGGGAQLYSRVDRLERTRVMSMDPGAWAFAIFKHSLIRYPEEATGFSAKYINTYALQKPHQYVPAVPYAACFAASS